MAKFNGSEFKLYVGTTPGVAFNEESELSLDIAVALIPTTSKTNGGWESDLSGLRTMTGSCKLIADHQAAGSGFKTILDAIVARTAVSFIAKRSSPTTGDVTLTFSANVTKLNYSAPMEAAVTVSFDFKVSGAPTIAYTV